MWNSSQMKVQDEGTLLCSWQQQAHFALFDYQNLAWNIYKAEPSKQAEPFLLMSQGQNTSRAHTCFGVGSVGVLGAPSSDQGEDSMGSWEKALPEGSQASALPEQPDLRSREAQIHSCGLWITLLGAAARCYHPQQPDLPDFTPFQLFSYRSAFQTLGQESCPGWKCHVTCIHLIPLMNNMAD